MRRLENHDLKKTALNALIFYVNFLIVGVCAGLGAVVCQITDEFPTEVNAKPLLKEYVRFGKQICDFIC